MTRLHRVDDLTNVRRRASQRGQGLVEFSLFVPIFLMLLLGMLEFGTAFNHQLTLEYATREGTRIGADLVNGGGTLGCLTNQSPNAANVDQIIVESVDRILTAKGSPIIPFLNNVTQIRIFKADQNGGDTLGLGDNWVYSSSPYTLSYDGTTVNFKPGTTQTWSACNRSNTIGNTYTNYPDSIGVSISYTYTMTTPLSTLLKWVGVSSLPMADATVMRLNPTTVTN